MTGLLIPSQGKTKLHEILTEESVVRYWEEFGTIAFDPLHDTLLTACTLKSPNKSSKKVVNCCFSFRIKKDNAQVYVVDILFSLLSFQSC